MFFGSVFHKQDKPRLKACKRNNVKPTSELSFRNGNLSLFSNALDLRDSNKTGFIIVGDPIGCSASATYSSVEEISKKVWGSYFIFYFYQDSLKEVYRSLTSTNSLYYKPDADGLSFGTHISDLSDMEGEGLNLAYLSRFLLCGQHLSTQTSFKDVSELQLGCSLLMEQCFPSKMVWNPCDHLENKSVDSASVADTLEGVIKTQTKDMDKIILDYSGGLDSTALLYTLQKTMNEKESLRAFNCYHSVVASSNEVKFARKVCDSLGVTLLEHNYKDKILPFAPVNFENVLLDKPDPMLIRYAADADIAKMMKTDGYQYLFNGEGGDHLFMCPPAMESLADLLLDKKLNLVWDKLGELATMFRINLFDLVKATYKNLAAYWLNNGYKNIVELTQFAAPWHSKDLLELQKTSTFHPFYYEKHRALQPGKFYQIDNLYIALSVVTSDIRNQLMNCFYPILTQPVIELALSIPTYDLYKDGYDRYPFRESIAKKYSTENVWRKDKGEATGTFLFGIKKHAEYISSLVMEGYFAREGLINKEILHQNIKQLKSGHLDNQWALIHLVAVELFLQHWRK